jgi:hypothetical protein
MPWAVDRNELQISAFGGRKTCFRSPENEICTSHKVYKHMNHRTYVRITHGSFASNDNRHAQFESQHSMSEGVCLHCPWSNGVGAFGSRHDAFQVAGKEQRSTLSFHTVSEALGKPHHVSQKPCSNGRYVTTQEVGKKGSTGGNPHK